MPGGDASLRALVASVILGSRGEPAVRAAVGVSGDVADARRPTPAAARSPTPTTSARRSPRSSATPRAYYLLGYSSTNDVEGWALPPHHGARQERPAFASSIAPATTPSATSRIRAVRIATRAAGFSSPRCLPPTPRRSSQRAGSVWRPTLLRPALGGHCRQPGCPTPPGESSTSSAVVQRRAGAPGRTNPPDAQDLAGSAAAGAKQMLYQSGLSLPPDVSRQGRGSRQLQRRGGVVRNRRVCAGSAAGAGEGELRSDVEHPAARPPVDTGRRTEIRSVRDGVETASRA